MPFAPYGRGAPSQRTTRRLGIGYGSQRLNRGQTWTAVDGSLQWYTQKGRLCTEEGEARRKSSGAEKAGRVGEGRTAGKILGTHCEILPLPAAVVAAGVAVVVVVDAGRSIGR